MPTSRPKARTIIEQPLVSKRLDNTVKEYPRLPEMFEAAKWRIAREPFRGATRVPDKKPMCYMIRTRPWKVGMVPSLTVLYRVTTSEVIIESLAVREE